MEYFHEKINWTQGQKRKTQTDLGGVYKRCQGERFGLVDPTGHWACWIGRSNSPSDELGVAYPTFPMAGRTMLVWLLPSEELVVVIQTRILALQLLVENHPQAEHPLQNHITYMCSLSEFVVASAMASIFSVILSCLFQNQLQHVSFVGSPRFSLGSPAFSLGSCGLSLGFPKEFSTLIPSQEA
ncbi:hypothetical protein F2Q69_00034736 [Brassica cretica]|uniref:Uncharacterized protein n=1 Tax=Brassica cretica TaxID=69181 RepID=A0A8S9SIW5_BRACR|nr:hypothetical protein F2Q69_00034736 [Brassica cretica]